MQRAAGYGVNRSTLSAIFYSSHEALGDERGFCQVFNEGHGREPWTPAMTSQAPSDGLLRFHP